MIVVTLVIEVKLRGALEPRQCGRRQTAPCRAVSGLAWSSRMNELSLDTVTSELDRALHLRREMNEQMKPADFVPGFHLLACDFTVASMYRGQREQSRAQPK